MRRLARGFAPVLAVLLMVAGGLAGCTSKQPPAATPAPAPAAPTPAAAPAPAPPAQAKAPEGPKSASLTFATWTYDLAKVKDNTERFEKWTLEDGRVQTKVRMMDFGFGVFESALTTRFMGGAGIDVLYGSDAWLSKWAKAGFIVPIEDHNPELRRYMDDLVPYVKASLIYNGKLYGLPYYADHMQLVYNQDMLQRAGFSAPPKDWQELTGQALAIKQKGISASPVLLALSNTPWLEEVFYSLVFSRGGHMFDAAGNASFGSGPAGPVDEALAWLVDAVKTHGIIPAKALDMQVVDVQEAFKKGDAAFVIVPSYMLAEFQNAATSQVAGRAKLALMPGTTHGTAGFGRAVFLGKSATTRGPEVTKAALQMVEYLGGKVKVGGTDAYHVSKRWTVENGLGFAYKSLWDDPDVTAALRKVGDLEVLKQQKSLAVTKEGMEHPWFAEWITYFRGELQKALQGKQSVADTLKVSNTRWQQLKAEFN